MSSDCSIIDIKSEKEFNDEVLKSDLLVVVDFSATWCGPCRVMEPVMETIAEEYKGRVRVAKVDVDKNPDLAAKYNVTALPTVFAIRDGEVVKSFVGALGSDSVLSFVKKLIGEK